MIYWKQTDVFGYPEPGKRVFVYYKDRIIDAEVVCVPAGDRWEIYDTADGECEIGQAMPLATITDWSEKNAPLTFRRA